MRLLIGAAVVLLVLGAWLWVGVQAQGDGPAPVGSAPIKKPPWSQEPIGEIAPWLAAAPEPLVDAAAADPVADPGIAGVLPVDVALAEVPHGNPHGNPQRQFVDDDFFEALYADSTLEELVAAKLRLQDEVARLSNEAIMARVDAGLAQVTIRSPPDPDDEWPEGKRSYGLIQGSWTDALPDGDLRQFSTELPWDEYTSLYDQQDEFFWLMRRLQAAIDGEPH